ncbi:hypothetical protein L1887_47288 [Cichorium endivia]|nr:hypothetical protein L1887_61328 [Cichorium endivia]KAI3477436.1 hypothetical protein L1887_60860 [Cichorium endivia]KAI3482241.1 hypothetical protein L1887_55125 [Cichorium endivia]KAI3484629.1 hypothetical protein L1887_52178 [Cichorium endivia]KAI3488673.1 hypothetical protein L1887_47288 [Cichorium endivia]
MDSPIDESDLGSLSHRRTSLEVEREGNRKGSPSLCLLLAAFLVHPALRRLQIQLQVSKHPLVKGVGARSANRSSISRAFFPVFNSSPARFELRVVGRPSRFASSRPAKKVKGSGQRVGGRCRTAIAYSCRLDVGHEIHHYTEQIMGIHISVKGNCARFSRESPSARESMREGSRRTGFRPNRARSQRADGEYAAEQPQGLPAVIAELTRWAAQNLELTLKSEINVGPRLSEEGRLKRRSRKCNTTRGEPKACAKEEANQSEWRQGGEKRKIEQCKGERSCPLFSGNPPPHMSKKRERGRKNNRFTLAHEVAGLARTNADPEEWVWAFEKMNMQRVRADGDSRTGKSGTRHLLNKTKNKAIPCPREKLVMIAMNAALEDVYKKEEFQPLLPLGRVSLLSELAGREDRLIHTNLESGWLIAASLSWRLSGRGGACYRNLFPGVNLVRSILREKKDGNEWEDWSSLFISRKELVSTSLIRRTNKKRLTV